MKKILKELLDFKTPIVLIIITVIATVFSNLALPAYLSTIINTAIPAKDTSLIFKIGGLMLIFVVISIIASLLTGYFSSKTAMGLGRNIRSKIFKKIQYFSQYEFDKFSTSSLITRTNNDILQVQNFFNMLLRISLMAPFMCIGGLVMAYNKNIAMSNIVLISIPIMVAVVLLIGKFATPLSKKMQDRIDNLNLVIREKLMGIRVARAFGTEEYEEERFFSANSDFMEVAIKMNNIIGFLAPSLAFILNGTTVALLAFGGYKIINSANNILIGDIIAVIQYVMQIMMAIMLLSMVFVMYPRASVSAKRINDVLDQEISVANSHGIKETSKKGYIEFKNVSFSFPESEEQALKNISFSSGPGEVTAIIGSTGSGKSTLVNLIPRFYNVTNGEILIDDVNIQKMDLKMLRQKIGYVPQKAFLFKKTIAENVKFGDPSAKDEDVNRAIWISQSENFVKEKEGGINSPITQGATNVSGGQKQRLSIARAILRNPEIYIFDDSFSALDFKTDAKLRNELFQTTSNATVILVAQRVSTIMNANRILVLENGEVAGLGTHKELLENCSVYQEIVYSQLNEKEIKK